MRKLSGQRMITASEVGEYVYCAKAWKLKLDGSGQAERLTYFSDYTGYKASNGVVSDDGRLVAFQLAKSTEAAGVGHGIFVLDLTRAKPAK